MSANQINRLELVSRPITAHDIAARTAEQTREFEEQHAKLFVKCAGLCHNETRLCPCPSACIDQAQDKSEAKEEDAAPNAVGEDAERTFWAVVVCGLILLSIMAFSALMEKT